MNRLVCSAVRVGLNQAAVVGGGSGVMGSRVVQSVVRVPVRSMGIIGDTFNKFTTDRAEATREKSYKKMLDSMLANPTWTLRPWREIMADQLDSWFMKIPGFNNTRDVTQLKAMKQIMDAMTEAELDNPDLINGIAKQRIAQTAGQPIEEVMQLLFMHKQSRIVAQWLNMKKAAGEPLPTSDVTLQSEMTSDPRVRGISMKIMHPNGNRKSGRGRRMF